MDRPLSSAESAFHHVRAACAPNIAVAVALDSLPDKAELTRAALALQARHPLLRVVVREGPTPHLVTASSPVPLSIVWERLDAPDAWLARVEQEMERPFAVSEGPLVRVIVLQGEPISVVLVVCDHLLGDGHVLNVMLDELFAFAIGRPPTDGPRAELPSLDTLLPRWPGTRTIGRLASLSAALARPAIEAMGSVTAALRAPPPARPPRVHLAHRTLDVETSRALSERARAEQCTVFGAMAAALFRALGAVGPSSGSRSIVAAIPVDIRDSLNPPVDPNDLGIYAWAPTHAFSAGGNEPFWTVARQARDRVTPTKRASALGAASLASHAWAPWMAIPELRQMAGNAPSVPGTRVVLSNMGRAHLPTVSEFGLRFGVYSAMVPSQDLVFIPGSFDGQIALTATWTDASRLAGHVPEVLATVARELTVAAR